MPKAEVKETVKELQRIVKWDPSNNGHHGRSLDTIALHDANFNIGILAERRDLPVERGTIIAQTPEAVRADCGTVIGVNDER